MQAARDPAFPFQILIASRPERVFQDFNNRQDARTMTRKVFLDEKYDPDTDIAFFLRSKFAEIRRRYGLPSAWPAEDAIQSVVKNASGQFIFAATVVRYVLDPVALPQDQLDRVLELRARSDNSNPFATLDELCRRILNSSPNPRLAAKWILAIQFGQDLPALCWRQFLESAPEEAEFLFSNLTSLVSTPSAHDSTSPYRFYHKSLFDFLIYRTSSADPLHIPPYGLDSVGELRDKQFIQVVQNKGPSIPASDAEKDIFLSHLLTRTFSYFFPTFSLHKLHVGSKEMSQTAAWVHRPESENVLLSCDVVWWIDWLISKYNRRTVQVGCPPLGRWSCISDILAGFFGDVHCKCTWYHCLPVCKRWRSTILRICQNRNWVVPGRSLLIRNRFVRWSASNAFGDGKRMLYMFPSPWHFGPLLELWPAIPFEALEEDEDLEEDPGLSDSRDLRYAGYIRDPCAGVEMHDSVRYNAHHRKFHHD